MPLASSNQKIRCHADSKDSISGKERAIFYFLKILVVMCSFSPSNIFDNIFTVVIKMCKKMADSIL